MNDPRSITPLITEISCAAIIRGGSIRSPPYIAKERFFYTIYRIWKVDICLGWRHFHHHYSSKQCERSIGESLLHERSCARAHARFERIGVTDSTGISCGDPIPIKEDPSSRSLLETISTPAQCWTVCGRSPIAWFRRDPA